MNDRDVRNETDPSVLGGRTSNKGTPVAVTVAADPAGRRALAMFLAGPLIWTFHFVVVYLAVEAGCTGDGAGLEFFDPPVPTILTIVATAIATSACVAAAAWAYRSWKKEPSEANDDGDPLADGSGTLALGGFLLSSLAAIVVLFVGLPAVVLPACA